MAENLDISQPIVMVDPDTNEMKATPYFEDYLFLIVQELGGEGSTVTSDTTDLANSPPGLPLVIARVSNIEKEIENLQQVIPSPDLRPEIAKATKNITENTELLSSIDSQVASIGPILDLIAKIGEDNRQLIASMASEIAQNKSQIDTLIQRIDDLEQP